MTEYRYPRTILATACIPWTSTFGFDDAIFRQQVQCLTGEGFTHVYLFGTAGEGYAVTDGQFRDIVETFADTMRAPGLFPMVGLISLSLPVMRERLQTAYDLGIRDFQISLPGWGALSDREMDTFFHAICDPYPDCRFLLYNLVRSKRLVTPEEFFRLAEEIPNLAGAKFTGADIPAIHALAGSGCPMRFFLGERNVGYGSLFGEFGFLISMALTNPRRAWEFFRAGVDRDTERLREMIGELTRMHAEFIRLAGPGRIDGAYDKIFAKFLVPDFPLRLLPPYEEAGEAAYQQYRRFLEEHFPQWLPASTSPKGSVTS